MYTSFTIICVCVIIIILYDKYFVIISLRMWT